MHRSRCAADALEPGNCVENMKMSEICVHGVLSRMRSALRHGPARSPTTLPLCL
jgi:hypothetical protein